MTNSCDLECAWKKSGINYGDCVLVHSNVSRLTRRLMRLGDKNPLDTILKSFLSAVGGEGTIMFPLFNFDFTQGTPFSVKDTPSQMGALTEYARSVVSPYRSGHPIYSFCAFGKYANDIHATVNKRAYSEDSPFGFLRQVNGKIAVLDLEDQGSMTFYHHVEEVCKVPYRYEKEFSGLYENVDGITESKTFSIYVRDLDRGVQTHVNPAGEEMWNLGIYKGDRPGQNFGLRTASAVEVFDFVKDVIDSGNAENMLFRYSED